MKNTIFNEVQEELNKIHEKWGEQNHPMIHESLIEFSSDTICDLFEIPTESQAKRDCEYEAMAGTLSYFDILIEEVSEALSCGKDITKMRQELIQVAAVTMDMIAAIDRNGK
jgi:hypothetical protein